MIRPPPPQKVRQDEMFTYTFPYLQRITAASLNMQNTSDNDQAANTTDKLQMVTSYA